jgi:hypothetical protein
MQQQNIGQLGVQSQQAQRQIFTFGHTMAIGDMADSAAVDVDHAPTKGPQARINPENTHRCSLIVVFLTQ